MNNEVLKAKEAVVSELKDKLSNSQTLVVFEYRGMNVQEITALRRALRAEGTEIGVYKNTLLERAAESLGHKDLLPHLVGPNAFAFSKDVIAGPKVLAKFAKRNEKLVIKGGIVEGKVVSAKQMVALAALPGRDGLISMFLSVLQAPVRQFACAVQGIADKAN
ncbi:MAG TPA: 50S ribosomal protein L10 [Bacilli bacterium]|mgnify:FL=1|jgi:large subunit ribosomal protein L10|nr:50S ribosomal protein L10 [Bacilli bacterium]HOF53353.1 50S ribosomal protein L10 [Bacilli bacterium]HOR20730.1 50S ribosomal protein L10 [Bacilli bacterium]HPK67976.1 50S ribosomal protein L10 [Bacilli bacterium]HPV69508.1 50S ribosomal protein L10 [Bacilli bacterium]